MITNNLDLKDIEILGLFNNIGYSLYRNDKNIIEFGNGYYYIHFYKNEKTYYSEDKRDIVRLIIDYCMNNFDELIKVKNYEKVI